MPSGEVDGGHSQECEIVHGRSIANPAAIPAEGDVKHPVQTVLNRPVLTNGTGQNIG